MIECGGQKHDKQVDCAWDDTPPRPPCRACLWKNGKVAALAGSGANSGASGVNNKGQTVGESDGVPVIWDDGKMTDLNTLIPANSGWTLLHVSDIDDKGQIVGNGKLKGRNRAFLLTPKP